MLNFTRIWSTELKIWFHDHSFIIPTKQSLIICLHAFFTETLPRTPLKILFLYFWETLSLSVNNASLIFLAFTSRSMPLIIQFAQLLEVSHQISSNWRKSSLEILPLLRCARFISWIGMTCMTFPPNRPLSPKGADTARQKSLRPFTNLAHGFFTI